jgi:hypothetical protein
MKELHVFHLESCLMDTGLQQFQQLDWAEYNLFLFTVIKKFFWVFCAGLASILQTYWYENNKNFSQKIYPFRDGYIKVHWVVALSLKRLLDWSQSSPQPQWLAILWISGQCCPAGWKFSCFYEKNTLKTYTFCNIWNIFTRL